MNRQKKKELRKQIALEKTRYCDSTLKEWSAHITEQIEAEPTFRNANIIVLYHSMKDEVYTHSFIEKWSNRKRILLPVVKGNELELRVYTNPDDLIEGAYGIKEPSGEIFTDYSLIDLIIIPGVTFDKKGYRLGRGKGYYDRFLTQTNAYKIGICFPFQLVEEVPTEAFDICMDKVITCRAEK